MSDPRHPLSVLVVDDCPDTAGSTAELLTLAGHRVRTALRGEEAVRLTAADQPDVVLLDIRMPGMDGYAVARRLALGFGGKSPILVAMTGDGSAADRERTARAGFHLHLVKPADPAVLLGLLRRFEEALGQSPPHDRPAKRGTDAGDECAPSRTPRHEYVG